MLLNKGHLYWIGNLIYGFRLKMLIYFLMEICSLVLALSFVYFSKLAVDTALNVEEGNLKIVMGIVIMCSLLGVFCRIYSQRIGQLIVLNLSIKLQKNLVYRQVTAVWSVIKKWHTGDLLVRINSDSAEVVQMVGLTWITAVVTIVKLIASLVFLYLLDPMLALIVVGISPIFIFSKIYFKKMRKLNVEIKQVESTLGGIIQESLRLRVLIRSLGITKVRQDKLEHTQQDYRIKRIKAIDFSVFSQVILKYTVSIGYLTVFVWGVYKLNKGEITFGTMTAFLQLVSHIQGPIVGLLAILPSFIRFGVSLDRVMEIDRVNEEVVEKPRYFKSVDNIQFDNVSFAYEESEILSNLNLSLKKGTTVAVTGDSGKGKTTLIRMLLALLTPSTGSISIVGDGRKEDLSADHLVNFAYVPQGNTLFSGSIRENLLITDKDISEDKIEEALKIASADFVFDLPEGIDTKIGESGLGLSEGQSQRISIARALLKDSHILLFDEATSALDETTSSAVVERIFSQSKDKIVIFVTHDLNLARKCDLNVLIS